MSSGRIRLIGTAALVAVLLVGCAAPSPRGQAVVDAGGPGVRLVVPAPPRTAFEAVVLRVVDGDTLRARAPDGRSVRVRLIGVDAPETVRPDTPVQCYGPQASAALTALLPVGTRVRAAVEPGRRVDRYGRELWDVWLPDGRLVGGVLVARGLAVARSFPPTTAHAPYLLETMAQARDAGRGLWRACPAEEVPRHDRMLAGAVGPGPG